MVTIDRLSPDLLSSTGQLAAPVFPDFFVEGVIFFKRAGESESPLQPPFPLPVHISSGFPGTKPHECVAFGADAAVSFLMPGVPLGAR